MAIRFVDKQVLKNHSMEHYRLEVLDMAKKQPLVQPHWNFADLSP